MPRPRDLDIPLGFFATGLYNTITDVPGVRVSHVTIRDDTDQGGHSEIHTGVTCIWPHEAWPWEQALYAGSHVLNGHGALIGITEINEYGILRSPILLTSSLYIGAVYDATARWASAIDERQARTNFFMPVVAEVSDTILSDNRRFPITTAHVEQALTSNSLDPPLQGSVGAGAGTICYGLKGGIGCASRIVSSSSDNWTVGALVLTNYGARRNLTIAGVRVGAELDVPSQPEASDGSCIAILATDAPLLPHQLQRLALRGSVGLTRSGGFAGHTSGEISLAFSTATRVDHGGGPVMDVRAFRDGPTNETAFNGVFEAAVEAVNEAVLNSLFEAKTTTGLKGRTVHALPIDETLRILARHGVRRSSVER